MFTRSCCLELKAPTPGSRVFDFSANHVGGYLRTCLPGERKGGNITLPRDNGSHCSTFAWTSCSCGTLLTFRVAPSLDRIACSARRLWSDPSGPMCGHSIGIVQCSMLDVLVSRGNSPGPHGGNSPGPNGDNCRWDATSHTPNNRAPLRKFFSLSKYRRHVHLGGVEARDQHRNGNATQDSRGRLRLL